MNTNQFEPLPPVETVKAAAEIGAYKVNKPFYKTFLLAMTAGLHIGIAFIFYTTVTTGTSDVAPGLAHFVGGLAFSLGLILVVVTGSELFTSSTLVVVARATGKVTWGQLAKNWIHVYFGNFAGCLLLVGIMLVAQQYTNDGGLVGINAMQIAQHKMHHSFMSAVALGLMANLMVCIAVWMSYSGRTLTDKMLILILPVAMFVASGFEHSIANMFQIPMAIGIKTFASPEFWQMTGMSPADFADLNLADFVMHNLIPVTIGNIIGGGVFVGLWFWMIFLKNENKH
ncbi:MAG: formate transporter FocA [Vibrio sp.]